MANRTISLIAGAGNTESVRAWATDVLSAWPGFSDPPETQFLDLRECVQDPDRIAGAVAFLLVDDPHDPDLHKLVDMLEPRLTPLVVVTRIDQRRPHPVLGHTVLFAPQNSKPQTVAAMLMTLVERQPFIDELRSEIRMAQRFQGGLREEMSKMHDEMQLAGRVQREFLPATLPRVDGLEFDVLFRPCSYVSGDIYDIVRLDDNLAGFMLADAVGHGVPAALMTMVLTRSLPMVDYNEDGSVITPPAEALARLNRSMIRGHGGANRFATAVYGVIDSRDRTVTIAGAGHPAPLIIGPDSMRPVETEGPLLGVFPDAVYDQATFQLGQDEMLLVYSDGFETAFPLGGDSGLDRRAPTLAYVDHFRDLAKARAESGLPEAMRRLADSIDLQAGSLHQIDDLSALVVAASNKADAAGARRVHAAPGRAVA